MLSVCSHFDKNIDMPPSPRGVELPKHDKYIGTANPHIPPEVEKTLYQIFMQDS